MTEEKFGNFSLPHINIFECSICKHIVLFRFFYYNYLKQLANAVVSDVFQGREVGIVSLYNSKITL